jgi:hypothetical protein
VVQVHLPPVGKNMTDRQRIVLKAIARSSDTTSCTLSWTGTFCIEGCLLYDICSKRPEGSRKKRKEYAIKLLKEDKQLDLF